MTMIVIKQGSEVPVGRAVGLIYVGMDELYPIVGRYSLMQERGESDYSVRWRELAHVLSALVQRVSPLQMPKESYARAPLPVSVWGDWKVICDATNNPPELMDQGRIAVTILIKPSRIPEFVGGAFTLARVLNEEGRGCLEIEYKPLRY